MGRLFNPFLLGFYDPRLTYAPLVLVATRSTAALRNFLGVLSEYGRFRERGKKREILVVNGENIPVNAASWEDLALPPGMADDIRVNVEVFFRSREKYRNLGIPHRRGLLFAGPPGCGKTLTIKVLASTVHHGAGAGRRE